MNFGLFKNGSCIVLAWIVKQDHAKVYLYHVRVML